MKMKIVYGVFVITYALFGSQSLMSMEKRGSKKHKTRSTTDHIEAPKIFIPLLVQGMLEQKILNPTNPHHKELFRGAFLECIGTNKGLRFMNIVELIESHYPAYEITVQKETGIKVHFLMMRTYNNHQKTTIKSFIKKFKQKATNVKNSYEEAVKDFTANKISKQIFLNYMENLNITFFNSIAEQKEKVESSLADFYARSIMVNKAVHRAPFFEQYPNFKEEDLTKHLTNLDTETDKITAQLLASYETFKNTHTLALLENITKELL